MCQTITIEWDEATGDIKSIIADGVPRKAGPDLFAEIEKLAGKASKAETKEEFHAVKTGISQGSHTHTH